MINKEILKAWKKIYFDWKYTISATIISSLVYTLNVFITHYNDVTLYFKREGFIKAFGFLFLLSKNYHKTITLWSFITLLFISILTSILLTLIFFRIKSLKVDKNQKKIGWIPSVGLFLGIAAPGCAACGMGLLAFFGFTGTFLSFLPLKGIEISLLAVGILAFSVLKISKTLLGCNSCQTNLNRK